MNNKRSLPLLVIDLKSIIDESWFMVSGDWKCFHWGLVDIVCQNNSLSLLTYFLSVVISQNGYGIFDTPRVSVAADALLEGRRNPDADPITVFQTISYLINQYKTKKILQQSSHSKFNGTERLTKNPQMSSMRAGYVLCFMLIILLQGQWLRWYWLRWIFYSKFWVS